MSLDKKLLIVNWRMCNMMKKLMLLRISLPMKKLQVMHQLHKMNMICSQGLVMGSKGKFSFEMVVNLLLLMNKLISGKKVK